MQRKVFVLGAGFSAHAGLPLVKGLRKAVLEYIDDNRLRFFWADGMRDQFYEGLKRADESLTALGKPVEESFEELLSLLQKMKAEDPTSPAFITDHILRCGTGRLLWEANSRAIPVAYRRFVSHLRESSGAVSFNWDILLESSLRSCGVPWSYDPNDPCLAVIKPHGSINWSNHEQLGSSGDQGWRPIFKGSKLSVWLPKDENTESSSEFHDPFSDCSNAELNYMLFPFDPEEESKGANAASIIDKRSLWNQASALLKESDVVMFLGYSLPQYDNYALQRIQEACIGKRVQVINPSADDAQKLKRRLAIPDEFVEIRLERFEDSEYGK